MKKENIIYGILAVLVITGIYFAFNSNKTTEVENPVKNIAKNEVKNVATGEIIETKTTEVVKVENNETNETKKSELEEDEIPAKFIAENNLPPYPGKDGGSGLYGTDSNENGVRDDVERLIAWSYKDYPKIRDLYYAKAKSYDERMKIMENEQFDYETLINNGKKIAEFSMCTIVYPYIVTRDFDYQDPLGDFGKIMVNTDERFEMMDRNFNPEYENEVSSPEFKTMSELNTKVMDEDRKYGDELEKKFRESEDPSQMYNEEYVKEFCQNLISEYID